MEVVVHVDYNCLSFGIQHFVDHENNFQINLETSKKTIEEEEKKQEFGNLHHKLILK